MGSKGSPKELGEKRLRSHFIHHKSRMKSAGIEPKAVQLGSQSLPTTATKTEFPQFRPPITDFVKMYRV
jgi:hypothetical protein